jgi:hypothetical protein
MRMRHLVVLAIALATTPTAAEVQRDLLAFLGGFDEACQPRHLPWRRAHDIVNYLSLNFFDAVLRGDAAALGRLDPQVVAGIEELKVWRK